MATGTASSTYVGWWCGKHCPLFSLTLQSYTGKSFADGPANQLANEYQRNLLHEEPSVTNGIEGTSPADKAKQRETESPSLDTLLETPKPSLVGITYQYWGLPVKDGPTLDAPYDAKATAQPAIQDMEAIRAQTKVIHNETHKLWKLVNPVNPERMLPPLPTW
ncbi:hypothetical protein FQN55_003199 [Onygenales sp. PD_40]|nr:hypothetical protein FQN55_003199 [Onygenales sp. PD_40]KAK2794556.1 hypothetical protein FQN52_008137 [Onygenales sp. PD_12]